jgi:predicted nucleotidyltransferase component of viral defense system
MILQREIAAIAEQGGVSKTTIDKDWVLGHFVDAIFSVKELKDILIFKGGTCLKKCYFPNYRFSEDLDFTCTDEEFELTKQLFENVITLVTERTGMNCQIASFRDLIFKDVKTGYEIIVKYWGSDHQINAAIPSIERWQTSIKVEIILYELLLFPPVMKELIHPYSDKLSINASNIPCYSIEEVIAEKIRALVQRKYTAPRDYYDIWYLTNNYKELNNGKIASAFLEKMKYKNLVFTGIEQLINEKNKRILKHNWQNSLGHQIAKDQLADYSFVIAAVQTYFEKILK